MPLSEPFSLRRPARDESVPLRKLVRDYLGADVDERLQANAQEQATSFGVAPATFLADLALRTLQRHGVLPAQLQLRELPHPCVCSPGINLRPTSASYLLPTHGDKCFKAYASYCDQAGEHIEQCALSAVYRDEQHATNAPHNAAV